MSDAAESQAEPFHAQPVDVLRRRACAALLRVWDMEAMKSPSDDAPAKHRSNLFDFEDGVRLLIYREKWPPALEGHPSQGEAKVSVHVTIVFEPAGVQRWHKRMTEHMGGKQDMVAALGWFEGMSALRIEELFPGMKFMMVACVFNCRDGGLVPHLYYVDKTEQSSAPWLH